MKVKFNFSTPFISVERKGLIFKIIEKDDYGNLFEFKEDFLTLSEAVLTVNTLEESFKNN